MRRPPIATIVPMVLENRYRSCNSLCKSLCTLCTRCLKIALLENRSARKSPCLKIALHALLEQQCTAYLRIEQLSLRANRCATRWAFLLVVERILDAPRAEDVAASCCSNIGHRVPADGAAQRHVGYLLTWHSSQQVRVPSSCRL